MGHTEQLKLLFKCVIFIDTTKLKRADGGKCLPQIVLLFYHECVQKVSPLPARALLCVPLPFICAAFSLRQKQHDTTQGVTQGKKNKLICVADFCHLKPPSSPLCSVLRSPDLKCTVPFDSRRTQHPGENHYGEGVGVYMDLFRGLLGIKPWRMTQIKKRRRRKKFD